MFIHSILEIIMLETDSNVFVNDIIESFLKRKYVDLDKQMEGSRFSCKFVSNLSIKCEKENKKK